MKKISLAFLLALVAFLAPAATITFTLTNSVGQPDTNAIKLWPIASYINADGSIQTTGLPFKIYPNTNGFVSVNLQQGNWLATNSFICSQYVGPGQAGTSQGLIFAVPSGAGTYAAGLMAISGYNVYNYSGASVGTSLSNIVTALGYVPLAPVATNAMATTNWVNAQGFTNSAVTNGLASIQYVTNAIFHATNGFAGGGGASNVIANLNGFGTNLSLVGSGGYPVSFVGGSGGPWAFSDAQVSFYTGWPTIQSFYTYLAGGNGNAGDVAPLGFFSQYKAGLGDFVGLECYSALFRNLYSDSASFASAYFTNFYLNGVQYAALAGPSITNGLASASTVSNYTLLTTFNSGTNTIAALDLANLQATNAALLVSLSAQSNALAAQLGTATQALWQAKQPGSSILTNLSITGAVTNQFVAGQGIYVATNFGTVISLNASNQTFLTNGFTSLVYTNPAQVAYTNQFFALTNGYVTASITNGLLASVPPSATNVLQAPNLVGAVPLASLPAGMVTNNSPTATHISLGYLNLTNAFYSNGHNIISGNSSSAFLFYPSGARLADYLGNTLYVSGQPLTDSGGNIYYNNSDMLADPDGNLYGNGSNLTGLVSSQISDFNSAVNNLAQIKAQQATNGFTSLVYTNPLQVAYTNQFNGLTNGFLTYGDVSGYIQNGQLFASILNLNAPASISGANAAPGTNINIANGGNAGGTGFVGGNGASNVRIAVGGNGSGSGSVGGNGGTVNIAIGGNGPTKGTNGTINAGNIYASSISGNGSGLTNIPNSALQFVAATNGAGVFATNVAGLGSIAFSNRLAYALIDNQPLIPSTNNLAATNYVTAVANGLVAQTNGVAQNVSIGSNLNFGTQTNFLVSTNLIGIIGAGSPAVNGTYLGNSFSSSWTNLFNLSITLNFISGSYYIQTNSTSLYVSTTLTNWSTVSGINPAPQGAWGSKWLMNGTVLNGPVYSASIASQIQQATNGLPSGIWNLGTAASANTNWFLGTNSVVTETSGASGISVDATGKATFSIRTNISSGGGLTTNNVINIVNSGQTTAVTNLGYSINVIPPPLYSLPGWSANLSKIYTNYVMTNGSDLTAKTNDITHPYRTLDFAASNAASWLVISVGPGLFTNNWDFELRNFAVIGAGQTNTYIQATTNIIINGDINQPGNNAGQGNSLFFYDENNFYANFTGLASSQGANQNLWNGALLQGNGDGWSGDVTNVVAESVTWLGYWDGGQNLQGTVGSIYNSTITTSWDTWQVSGSGGVWSAYNTAFNAYQRPPFNLEIRLSGPSIAVGSKMFMYGGSVYVNCANTSAAITNASQWYSSDKNSIVYGAAINTPVTLLTAPPLCSGFWALNGNFVESFTAPYIQSSLIIGTTTNVSIVAGPTFYITNGVIGRVQ